MFLSKNKKYNVYPCKPQFYYIKVRFKGVKIIQVSFGDEIKGVSRCFSYVSTKTYVVGNHWKHPREVFLMCNHNLLFPGEI